MISRFKVETLILKAEHVVIEKIENLFIEVMALLRETIITAFLF